MSLSHMSHIFSGPVKDLVEVALEIERLQGHCFLGLELPDYRVYIGLGNKTINVIITNI